MRFSVLGAFGFTALFRTRTSYRLGATRLTHDRWVIDGGIRARSVIGHHGEAVVKQPARPAIIRHKLDMTRLFGELVSSRSLREMNRARPGDIRESEE
jgi:hypothetical protein